MPTPPETASRPAPGAPAAGLVALADRCVQCGLCLPHCPTYGLDRSEAESPRGRIAYIRATASGQLAPTAAGDIHLDHCLGCRRCEQACPAGVEYGALLLGARAAQAQRRPASRPQRLAGWLLARPPLLGRLLDAHRLLAPVLPGVLAPGLPPPARPQPLPDAAGRPTLAVFAGCIADRHESGTRAALAKLLGAAGLALALPAGQGCCGAAAAHAGDAATAARLGDANRAAFQGHERVLCLASGCLDTLSRSLDGGAEDALAALDALGDRLAFRPAAGRVALHLPCTQRSGAALRRLLGRIPGLDVAVLPDAGCCGAAGLHQVAFPDRAAALRGPVHAAVAASGATLLLSANIGCRLHLAQGLTIPVRHPLDFLAEHLA
ncbi:MAG TPA: heterodisulfide reductase-related iron-sulfur binding cluster [Arenimonas sp.]|uniref:(Fe-S)-binding protein n=1 Tax=Arenimonas sp. TaxID=1872635 RepID=UPI002D7E1CE2|nr:heterodisulfide reductase-related iron-sulfur binding cluster [Arenimonas sp.]HEU0151933.1 heterodisulfide reductase-related iron-sulfur binding cluster [Arenimonas sp.]